MFVACLAVRVAAAAPRRQGMTGVTRKVTVEGLVSDLRNTATICNLWVSQLSGTWRFHGFSNFAAGANRWTSAEFSLLFCLPVHYFWMLLILVNCLYLFLCQPLCGLQRHSWIGRVQSSCCKVSIGILSWKMLQLAHKQHPQARIPRLIIISGVTRLQ